MPRLSQLLVTAELLASWFRDGFERAVPVRHHLPPDASIFGVYNAHPGIIGIVFSSESFADIDAETPPAMLPLIQSPVLKLAAPPPGAISPSDN